MKTEKETRQDIIDKKLFQAGWNVNDRTQVIEEFELLAKMDHVEKEDFNEIWEMLYEWSDSLIFNESGRTLNCNIKTS